MIGKKPFPTTVAKVQAGREPQNSTFNIIK